MAMPRRGPVPPVAWPTRLRGESRSLNSTSARVRSLQAQRSIDQGLAEMMGLVRGVVADGVVSSDEATRLSEWTRANPETAARWPASGSPTRPMAPSVGFKTAKDLPSGVKATAVREFTSVIGAQTGVSNLNLFVSRSHAATLPVL